MSLKLPPRARNRGGVYACCASGEYRLHLKKFAQDIMEILQTARNQPGKKDRHNSFIVSYLHTYQQIINAFSCPASQSTLKCLLVSTPDSRNGQEDKTKTCAPDPADATPVEFAA